MTKFITVSLGIFLVSHYLLAEDLQCRLFIHYDPTEIEYLTAEEAEHLRQKGYSPFEPPHQAWNHYELPAETFILHHKTRLFVSKTSLRADPAGQISNLEDSAEVIFDGRIQDIPECNTVVASRRALIDISCDCVPLDQGRAGFKLTFIDKFKQSIEAKSFSFDAKSLSHQYGMIRASTDCRALKEEMQKLRICRL